MDHHRCLQGLGLALAIAALKAGHNVLAGARNPLTAAQKHPELEAARGKWLELDVGSAETQSKVEEAVAAAG